MSDSDLRDVLEERGRRYGSFMAHALITQNLKDDVRRSIEINKRYMKADQREALDMIMHKVGRIVCGDPDYVDSWLDIAGYAQLVVDRLREEQCDE